MSNVPPLPVIKDNYRMFGHLVADVEIAPSRFLVDSHVRATRVPWPERCRAMHLKSVPLFCMASPLIFIMMVNLSMSSDNGTKAIV